MHYFYSRRFQKDTVFHLLMTIGAGLIGYFLDGLSLSIWLGCFCAAILLLPSPLVYVNHLLCTGNVTIEQGLFEEYVFSRKEGDQTVTFKIDDIHRIEIFLCHHGLKRTITGYVNPVLDLNFFVVYLKSGHEIPVSIFNGFVLDEKFESVPMENKYVMLPFMKCRRRFKESRHFQSNESNS